MFSFSLIFSPSLSLFLSLSFPLLFLCGYRWRTWCSCFFWEAPSVRLCLFLSVIDLLFHSVSLTLSVSVCLCLSVSLPTLVVFSGSTFSMYKYIHTYTSTYLCVYRWIFVGSIFPNANKWICSAAPSSSCEFRFGVARRLNKSNTVEGLRLCGCPALDINGDEAPCNHMRDFRDPLGRVSVQECITNAHCADRQLAYCIKDHCGGFLVSAAAASVNAFACVRNQDCTLENVAARGVSEALKVIPIAAHLKCGPEAALDPNFLPESALPCVADVDGDGQCDVHIGINHLFGFADTNFNKYLLAETRAQSSP